MHLWSFASTHHDVANLEVLRMEVKTQYLKVETQVSYEIKNLSLNLRCYFEKWSFFSGINPLGFKLVTVFSSIIYCTGFLFWFGKYLVLLTMKHVF